MEQTHLIYCVEDDDAIRELILYALVKEGYRAESFVCAEDMLAASETLPADLVILDIMLPGLDGISALKHLRAAHRTACVSVIMLTAKNSEINKVTGLDAGADDYITKPFSVLELLARVRANLRKKPIRRQGDGLCAGGITLYEDARIVTVNGEKTALTQKEFELLRFLMRNVGKAVGRETLLNEIWGYEYFGETRTVDIHMKNLREKLGGAGCLIQSVRGIGYRMAEEIEE